MAKNPSIEELIRGLITALDDDPTIIGNNIQIFGEDMAKEYHTVLLPAAKDANAWIFESAKRPDKRPETLPSGAVCHSGGMMCGGTDMAMYTFENDVWDDGDHTLIGTITYEFGEVIDIAFKVSW